MAFGSQANPPFAGTVVSDEEELSRSTSEGPRQPHHDVDGSAGVVRPGRGAACGCNGCPPPCMVTGRCGASRDQLTPTSTVDGFQMQGSASEALAQEQDALAHYPQIRRLIEQEVARQVATVCRPATRPTTAGSNDVAGLVTIAEMVQCMPRGLRSESSVRRRIRSGEIPARKYGGRWALDPVSVLAALQREASGAERVAEFQAVWHAKEKEEKQAKIRHLFHRKTRKNCERSRK